MLISTLVLGIVALVVVYLIRESGQTYSRSTSGETYIDRVTQPSADQKIDPWSTGPMGTRCERCQDEFDPLLYETDAHAWKAANEFWLRHELCKRASKPVTQDGESEENA